MLSTYVEPIDDVLWLPLVICACAALQAASVIFSRRIGGWPAILLVIGSSAYLLLAFEDAFFVYVVQYSTSLLHSDVFRHWSIRLVERTLRFATLCFPVGFLSLAVRTQRI